MYVLSVSITLSIPRRWNNETALRQQSGRAIIISTQHGHKSKDADDNLEQTDIQTFRLVFAQLREANSAATTLLVEPRAKTSSAQSKTCSRLSSAQASSCNKPQTAGDINTLVRTSLTHSICKTQTL